MKGTDRCGHSACSQHFIDTGDAACVAKPPNLTAAQRLALEMAAKRYPHGTASIDIVYASIARDDVRSLTRSSAYNALARLTDLGFLVATGSNARNRSWVLTPAGRAALRGER